MTGTEPTAPELEILQTRIQKLEAYIRTSQLQMRKVVEMLESQAEQLRSQQTSVARVDRVQNEMLSGRVWRSLRTASGIAQKLLGRGRHSASNTTMLVGKPTFLVCDEPSESDRNPRSGVLTVRGWCLAQGGVDDVELEISGMRPVRVKPSLPRPDVKRALPELDTTGRSGFVFEVDSAVLPNATYPILLRLYSRGVAVRETRTVVVIDHEKGFASPYERWISEFEVADEHLIALKLASFQHQPKFSILMPVYNTVPAELKAAIESVLNQSYPQWELCIADDASSKPEPRELLAKYAAADPRIRVKFRSIQGGISASSNTAAEMATGDFIALLDHDDLLAPNALAHVCEVLEQHSDVDFIYSDEDKVDSRGRRFEPFFKPDWSPDLLLSENYICHLLVLRSDLFKSIGGFRSAYDGGQDYDLILRAAAEARSIHHIPKVLYHWRAGLGSTASSIDNKHYALAAAHRSVENRLGIDHPGAAVEPSGIVGRWRVRYPVSATARVSIIIASGGKTDILRANIESIQAKTIYRNFEIVVVDNSKGAAVKGLLDELNLRKWDIRYIDQRNQPFNYSALNNTAAKTCESPLLLFLNDDTSVIADGWLQAMVELAERPDVGAVGAKLLYPDGSIQHAGVVMGLYDNCGHAFKSLDGSVSHYFDFSDIIRNVSAVTGACLMTRRQVFWEVGGFDEIDFAVAFNDIDLCLKIGRQGYRVLYTPHSVLRHYEALSKTSKDLLPHPREVARMQSKWEAEIRRDAFYSPNLTRNEEDFSFRRLT